MDINDLIQEHRLTDEQIEEIISKELPEWKKGCDSDIQGVVLHQDAFGYSTKELILQALAIKYAKQKGKEIHIISSAENQ